MDLKEYMPAEIKSAIEAMQVQLESFTEIRIRRNRPIILASREKEIFLKNSNGKSVIASPDFIEKIFHAIHDYSLYAHSDSIRQGFITVYGGHRIGFVGQAVLENKKIKTMTHISSLNIRISHAVKGVSDEIAGELFDDGILLNTLIISPPGFGKTTMLRDIIRNISNGNKKNKGLNVCVIDERSEIAACYQGNPYHDLGLRTDILDNAPKEEGMLMALRTMSPQVIAVDEIGTEQDLESVRQICKCGCSMIATAHGKSKNDLKNHPVMARIIDEKYFQRFIIIRKDGTSFVCS